VIGLRYVALFANFKWTGPADPAIRAALELRRLGEDVVFAQAAWTLPGAEHRMRIELQRSRMPVIGDLELRKHFHLPSLLRDARRLRARLERGDFDVVMTHLPADHLVAALARRRCRRRTLLVRSVWDADAPKRDWRSRFAFRRTDLVVAPTAACAAQIAERFRFAADRIVVQDPPTDASRSKLHGDLRGRLGVDASHFVVGITARIQPHRRFDLLWDVARRVVDAVPTARFVLLGRGNERDVRTHVTEPIERLALQREVVLPGYLYEPDYSLALRSLDAFVFLVPGSDGTCRALREAMALGLPCVATPRGILPELLGPSTAADGPCGVIADETVEALANALIALARSPERRRALGAAASARVRGPMDPVAAAVRFRSRVEASWRS
jgi:glycosyltransferase involved in cell wall biosynthesis